MIDHTPKWMHRIIVAIAIAAFILNIIVDISQ